MFNLGDFSMKKTLVAMAALASVSAFAQSTVTLSGRLDLGLNQISFKQTDATGLRTERKVSDMTGAQNTRTTSRITFSGSEDLGGGLRAGFNIETGLNPTDDASLISGSIRTGLLSLSGGFGTFGMGTYLNSMDSVRGFSGNTAGAAGGDFMARMATGAQAKDFLRAADNINLNTASSGTTGGLTAAQVAALGIPGVTTVAQYDAFSIGANGRSRNAFFYATPNFNGFSGSIGFNSQKNAATLGAASDVKSSGVMASVAYANGPLSTRLTIANGKQSFSVTGVQAAKNSDVGFAISYDVGVAKPYFIYETAKVTVGANNTVGADIKASGYELGATFALGSFRPYISFNRGDHKAVAGGVNVGKIAKQSAFQIGTLYDISKRTYVYTSLGNDTTKGVDGDVTSLKRSGFTLGLVHQF
jgi:predicted porin